MLHSGLAVMYGAWQTLSQKRHIKLHSIGTCDTLLEASSCSLAALQQFVQWIKCVHISVSWNASTYVHPDIFALVMYTKTTNPLPHLVSPNISPDQ